MVSSSDREALNLLLAEATLVGYQILPRAHTSGLTIVVNTLAENGKVEDVPILLLLKDVSRIRARLTDVEGTRIDRSPTLATLPSLVRELAADRTTATMYDAEFVDPPRDVIDSHGRWPLDVVIFESARQDSSLWVWQETRLHHLDVVTSFQTWSVYDEHGKEVVISELVQSVKNWWMALAAGSLITSSERWRQDPIPLSRVGLPES